MLLLCLHCLSVLPLYLFIHPPHQFMECIWVFSSIQVIWQNFNFDIFLWDYIKEKQQILHQQLINHFHLLKRFSWNIMVCFNEELILLREKGDPRSLSNDQATVALHSHQATTITRQWNTEMPAWMFWVIKILPSFSHGNQNLF